MFPLEIIFIIHKFSDIDTRSIIEKLFDFNKLIYPVFLPEELNKMRFRRVRDIYFNRSSVFYISIPIQSTYSEKNLIICRNVEYDDYYVTVSFR